MGATRTETNAHLTRVVELLEQIAATQPALSYTPERAAQVTGATVGDIYKLIADQVLEKVQGLRAASIPLIKHASLARFFGGES
jgi:hypothetical protein